MAGLVLLVPRNAPADLAGALQAYNNGQHEAAIAELLALAKAGDLDAKHTLGVIYNEGKAVPPDPEEAVKWFREAANEGNANAQFSLGAMYANGRGLPRNPVRGLMWLIIASQNLDQHPYVRMQAISNVAFMKKSMTPEQITEAEKLAAAWEPGQQ